MSLTDKEKQLIIESFAKVAPIAETAAELFYNRLFEIAPETKALFKETDMREQGRKLMQTLGTAVGALHQLEQIIPQIQALGRRHVAYGVTKEQYQPVGEALIWTLEKGLGDGFTDELRQAWVKVYTLLADVAKQAYPSVESDTHE
jgi:nitric oxide dioxygenase